MNNLFAQSMKTIVIFATSFSVLAFAHERPEDYDSDVARWEVVARFSTASFDEFSAVVDRARMSEINWNVRYDQKTVTAVLGEGYVEALAQGRPNFNLNQSKDKDPRGEPNVVHKVSDGWLASYNRGEFGGAVWWFSEDGSERRALSQHRVHQFITHENRIFAVEGLAHMVSSEGSVIEFIRTDHWTVSTFVELPQSGEAVVPLPDRRLCIVASDMLLALSMDGRLELLVPNARWGGLYPNSAVYDPASQMLYIGMRQFVARYQVTPANHSYDLMVPSRAFLSPSDL